ncbi:MAG: FAD-dependent oxidoreductase [Acidobacteriota bacterium]
MSDPATNPEITVYGSHWCPDCHRSKQFLGEQQIPYRWVDIEEDTEGEAFVIEANQGKRRIPTLTFGDGTVLSNPSNAELAQQLGFKTSASKSHYDLIIVGGGPSGLTAALYTAREGIDTLVIERAAFGGQAAATVHLDNVPGFPEGVTGSELSGRFRQQAERFGVELLEAQDVVGIHSHHNYHCVVLADGTEYSALAVLLATGSKYRRLGVEGEDDYLGSGVHYCATCDGPFYREQPVAVIGGGNSAAEESLFLSDMASHVTMLVRGDALRASQVIVSTVEERPNIDVRFHTQVKEFEGADSKLQSLRVESPDGEETLELPAAFVFIGLDPSTAYLKDTPVRLDGQGFVVTGHCLVHDGDRPAGYETRDPGPLETSVPGIFAAGDLRAGSTKQVASAAGEGAAVAIGIREFLRRH